MTRFADPSRCPDCGAPITSGAAACAACGLSLQGLAAQRLFATLSQADVLLVELRSASQPADAPGPPPPSPGAWTPPRAPGAPASPAPALSRGMKAVSVPRVLLTLGAGCLLVAALVFLAVAWSVLGVGGRTAVLVGFTAVAGSLAAWLARRHLRAAAEALALVGYGLLMLDVIGAYHAGWFDGLSTSGLLVVLGSVLASTGAAGALAARRTNIAGLVGAEIVAATGVGLVVLAVDLGDWLPLSVSLVLATPVAAAAAGALWRLRLHVAASGSGAVTVIAWLALLVYALDRVSRHDESWRQLWSGWHPVPLLAAAAMAAAPALVVRLPIAARVTAAAVGQPLVVYALLAPAEQLSPTAATLVGVAVLGSASVAAWFLPRPWALVNAGTQTLAGVVVFLVGCVLVIRAVARLVAATNPVWGGDGGDLLPQTPDPADVSMPWLLPLCVVTVIAALWALGHASPDVGAVLSPAIDRTGAASITALTVTATVTLYPVPVWVPVAMLLVAGAWFAARWLRTARPASLALASLFMAAGVMVSLHSDWLTAVALLMVLVLSGSTHLRSTVEELAGLAGVVLVATLAGSAWSWGSVVGGAPVWIALAGLLVVAAAVLIAPYAPDRWWRCQDPAEARIGIELGAAASAFPLGIAGVLQASTDAQPEWAAIYLTIAGVTVTAMSLLRSERRRLGWVGGLMLATASWVRLWDLGVSAPEAYTLPSAAALLVVGGVHLRRHAESSTMTAVAPGLSLALVPSLLWALDDPTGPRALLLGLACLVLVLAGVGLRWTAPIVLGATVGAVLVLRLAAPYVADAVPRWVLIGTAGAVLVALGATWERRITEARQLVGYVRELR